LESEKDIYVICKHDIEVKDAQFDELVILWLGIRAASDASISSVSSRG
jgi:hypothetical protein